MKKKSLLKSIVMLIMCFLMLFSLSSCGLAFVIIDAIVNGTDTVYSSGVKISDSVSDYISESTLNNKYILDLEKQAEKLVEEGTNYEEFINKVNLINEYYNDIVTTYRLIAMKDSAERGYDYSAEYNKYANALNELAEWVNQIEIKLSTSAFKSLYFAGMTDEEIARKIDSAKYSDTYKNLENTKDDILEEYYKLDSSSRTYQSSVEALYKTYVDTNKAMAVVLGESSYLDYIYDDYYSRDIKTQDVTTFYNNLNSIGTLYNRINRLYENELSQLLRNRTLYRQYINFIENDSFTDDIELISKFASYMGEDYNEIFNSTYPDGYFVTSSNSNSKEGAYTIYLNAIGKCGMYFGPGYQKVSTFIHEFGHNYALTSNGNLKQSLDTEEIHSQANELLFMQYFINENPYGWTELMLDCYKNYTLKDVLRSICVSSSVAELEIMAYQGYSGDYSSLFTSINSKLGLSSISLNSLYWSYVVFDSEGYYISYALSGVAALEIYSMAIENLDNAKNVYKNLCCLDTTDGFTNDLIKVGLSSVFEKTTIDKISNVLGA